MGTEAMNAAWQTRGTSPPYSMSPSPPYGYGGINQYYTGNPHGGRPSDNALRSPPASTTATGTVSALNLQALQQQQQAAGMLPHRYSVPNMTLEDTPRGASASSAASARDLGVSPPQSTGLGYQQSMMSSIPNVADLRSLQPRMINRASLMQPQAPPPLVMQPQQPYRTHQYRKPTRRKCDWLARLIGPLLLAMGLTIMAVTFVYMYLLHQTKNPFDGAAEYLADRWTAGSHILAGKMRKIRTLALEKWSTTNFNFKWPALSIRDISSSEFVNGYTIGAALATLFIVVLIVVILRRRKSRRRGNRSRAFSEEIRKVRKAVNSDDPFASLSGHRNRNSLTSRKIGASNGSNLDSYCF